jgi:pimeloyl-ACP methyl ester carboxylesterase
MDTVEVGGLRIAYERSGQGPPLVLLHGFVGDGPGTWRYQLDALSDEFTVVAWDAPGAGRSDDPPESFRLPDYAECLAGFVAALGLPRPSVAGVSFGSALALEFYGRFPSTPVSLVLASAYAGWAGSLPPDVAQERLRLSLALAAASPEERTSAMLPSMFSSAVPAERVRVFVESMSSFSPVGFRAMTRALAEADLRSVLPQIAVPTLLVYGGQDVRAPREVAEAIYAAVPGSELVWLPEAGHALCVEAPDEFNAEVRRFLRGSLSDARR